VGRPAGSHGPPSGPPTCRPAAVYRPAHLRAAARVILAA